jgi:hypothetical protein
LAMWMTSRRWVEPQSTHRCPSRANTIVRRCSQSDGSWVRGRRRHPLSVMAYLRCRGRYRVGVPSARHLNRRAVRSTCGQQRAPSYERRSMGHGTRTATIEMRRCRWISR